ncbi:MAG: hypothetical protein AMXMBFR19_00950 [Chthonomonadaceae bacterium]|uniref:Periplasmic protease n=1 Tax=Candidatus Nitrosymbiomonas proteolyticus TaxID=2608984 RepID=A0A809S2R7_9BACT|nr:periplasmic protease [Candidatus Nitrosymbiomonas proteolyticus]HQU17419.1 S41 family peptidase [Fimbriimonadaceae bacterium]
MNRLRAVSVVCWATLLSIGAAFAQDLSSEQKSEVLKAVTDIVENRAFAVGVDLKKWPENLAKHQEAIDSAATPAAFVGAVNRALREFGMSHISLRTPQSAERRRINPDNVVLGVTFERLSEGLKVSAVAETSPMSKLGLSTGDLIIEANGKQPGAPRDLLVTEAEKITLKVKKSSGEVVELQLEKPQQGASPSADTLTWADSESAVLRLRSFNRTYDRSHISTLFQEAKKAKYLVIDLRSNGGGLANNLQHFLSFLLPPNAPVGTMVSKRTVERYVEETKGDPSDLAKIGEWSSRKFGPRGGNEEYFKGKVAVLINRGSASASEMCASALRDAANAILVGQNSAGAVLASVFGRLPHGFEIQYPVSDYVTAKGVRLEGNPLKPDIEVERSAPAATAIEKAIEKLKASGDKANPMGNHGSPIGAAA